MSKSFLSLISLCFFISHSMLAQFTVSGEIQEEQSNQPISFATVSIFNEADSALVSGVLSDGKGNFELSIGNSGAYYLSISVIGYGQKQVSNLVLNAALPKIELDLILIKPSTQNLDEITVTAERAAIEYKIDRKVINLSKLGILDNAPLSEALQILPSIEADFEGNVKLRGSENFQVLIDGKPTILSGSDALKQFSAAQIDKIEIITNPSAKYDADNTSGIINLILKKGEGLGLSGIVNYGATKGGNKMHGQHEPFNVSTTLSFRQKKYAITGGFNAHNRTYAFQWSDSIERSNLTDYERISSNTVPWLVGRVSLDFDYFINDRHSITLAGRIMQRDYGYNILSEYQLAETNSSIFSQNVGDSERHTRAITLHDRLKLNGENHELTVLLTYYNQSIDEPQSILEFPTDELTSPNFESISNTGGEHNQFQIKADYSKPIGKNGSLEMGLNLQTIARNSFRELGRFIPEASPLKTDQFDVGIDTYAAYGTYSDKFKGIDVQMGLRLEQYNRLIKQLNSEISYDYKKLNLFPTLHLAKRFNDKQELKLSYSRRINRPSMTRLQPFVSNGNNFNSYGGNPNLKPANVNATELSYLHHFEKLTLTAEAYYRNTLSAIMMADRLNTETNILETIPINIDRSKFYGLESSLDFSAAKWLKIIASGTYFQNTISGEFYDQTIFRKFNAWRARLNTRISLTKSIKLSINGFYDSKTKDILAEMGNRYWLDLSVSSPILKKRGTLSFSLHDVFGTNILKTFVTGENFTLRQDFKYPGQIFGLNLSYKFNSYTNKENSFGFED